MGKGGEVFILDMGQPVKIVDMAWDLIRLMGKEPDVDVKIEFVGVRPGEKIHEELLIASEASRTALPEIWLDTAPPMSGDGTDFGRTVEGLFDTARGRDRNGTLHALEDLVTSYSPAVRGDNVPTHAAARASTVDS